MSETRFRAALAVALVTVLVALFLRYESAHHEITGEASSCSAFGSAKLDCDAVQASAYAKVLGVSLATWGAMGAGILLLWLLASRREPALLPMTGAAAAMAVPVVLYTAFVSWVKLGKICVYCSAMQAGFLAFAVLVGPAAWRARASLPRRPLLLGGVMAAILLALALSGEAYTSERVRLGSIFGRSAGKGLRLDISDTLLLGKPDSPVSVVLFFDFGCPMCRACVATATELVRDYPDCVHVRFKHYPLERECNETLSKTIHTSACRAALAGQAAQSQGLDAQALKAIFGHQEDGFSKFVLGQIGKEIGAGATWNELLQSPKTKALVDRDIAEGNTLGLRVVPTAFVNGREVDPKRLDETIGQLCR